MERTRRKIKCCFTIINVILAIGILYLAYKEYTNYQETLNKQEKIKQEYQSLMNDETIGMDEINDINNKINDLKNIDESIKKEKDTVFKLASDVEKKIKNNETSYKIAYLTFDDGPYYNTYKVLDILRENHVKATFFTTNVNGTNCYDNKKYDCHKLYKEYAKDNHTIANHTYTHGWNRGLYRNAQTFIDAVKKQENLIKQETGITTNIVRFPGGSGTPKAQRGQSGLNAMIEELRKNNYGWVDWTAQDGDGGYLPNYATGWKTFTGSINDPIEVVLFHDYHQVTTKMLPDVIKYLRDKNYILLPLFYESVMINK